MPQPRAIVPESGIRPGRNDDASPIGKYRLVTYDAAGGTDHVELATNATALAGGVTMEAIPAGRAGNVQREGKSPVVAGAGGIAIGDRVTADAAGGAVATVTSGNVVHGVCVAAAAATEIGEIELSGADTRVP